MKGLNYLDPIGLSFYLRTLNYSRYNKNQKIEIKVLTDNRIIETYIILNMSCYFLADGKA